MLALITWDCDCVQVAALQSHEQMWENSVLVSIVRTIRAPSDEGLWEGCLCGRRLGMWL